MNYRIQSEKIKPNAKSCDWCKFLNRCHDITFGEDTEVFKCEHDNAPFNQIITHRLNLKMIREEEFRYCKHYKYSKTNFYNWKGYRKRNEELNFPW